MYTPSSFQAWCEDTLGKRPAPSSLSIILKQAVSIQDAARNAKTPAELEKKKRRNGNVPELEDLLWKWWQNTPGNAIVHRALVTNRVELQ